MKKEVKEKAEAKEITIEKAGNPSDYERLRFVAKAVASGKRPQYQTVIHVEPTRGGTRLIATDGIRMHVAVVKAKIERGDYVPKGNAEKVTLEKCAADVRYPEWKRAMPEKAEFKAKIDLAKSDDGKTLAGAGKLSTAQSIITIKTGRGINFRYLSDLPEKEWNLYAENSKTKPVMLRDVTAEESAYAIISPLTLAAA